MVGGVIVVVVAVAVVGFLGIRVAGKVISGEREIFFLVVGVFGVVVVVVVVVAVAVVVFRTWESFFQKKYYFSLRGESIWYFPLKALHQKVVRKKKEEKRKHIKA